MKSKKWIALGAFAAAIAAALVLIFFLVSQAAVADLSAIGSYGEVIKGLPPRCSVETLFASGLPVDEEPFADMIDAYGVEGYRYVTYSSPVLETSGIEVAGYVADNSMFDFMNGELCEIVLHFRGSKSVAAAADIEAALTKLYGTPRETVSYDGERTILNWEFRNSIHSYISLMFDVRGEDGRPTEQRYARLSMGYDWYMDDIRAALDAQEDGTGAS